MRDLVFGLVFLGLGVWVWLHTGDFPTVPGAPPGPPFFSPGPSLFPRLIALGMILAGLSLMLSGLKSFRPGRLKLPGGLIWIGLAAALGISFPWLQTYLGFVPAVALLSFAISLMLKAHPLWAALTGTLGALAIYWIFARLLGVPL